MLEQLGTELRENFLTLPGKCGAHLVGRSAEEIQTLLRDEVYEYLERFSEGAKHLPTEAVEADRGRLIRLRQSQSGDADVGDDDGEVA